MKRAGRQTKTTRVLVSVVACSRVVAYNRVSKRCGRRYLCSMSRHITLLDANTSCTRHSMNIDEDTFTTFLYRHPHTRTEKKK